jgi:hypothetical protein
MARWVEHYFPDHREEAFPLWMLQVTGSRRWGERFGEVFNYGKGAKA